MSHRYHLFTSNEVAALSDRADRLVFTIDGHFGGGTMEIGWISQSGAFVKHPDIAPITSADSGAVIIGSGGELAFKLTGAEAPALHVEVFPLSLS